MKKIFIISILIIIVDQFLKFIISSYLTLGHSIKVINNFFYLTLAHNKGAAWSILEGRLSVIIIVSILVIIFFIYYIIKNKNNIGKLESIAYSLIVGGAAANLIDRLIHGYVIDYLDFLIFNYDFPIFNLADSCIIIGVGLVFINEIRGKKNDNK